ncbi:acetate/propionate family kinase [Candidatus Latescibacterota bacterium]
MYLPSNHFEVDLNVLVINCGSSSVKFRLIETADASVLAKGAIERLGLDSPIFNYSRGDGAEISGPVDAAGHTDAVKYILELLTDPERGVIDHISDIGAIGHRFVHGGTLFRESVALNIDVLEKIGSILDLAPLHNPANLLGINACFAAAPDTPQVVVFDTAFHASLTPEAYMYALPQKYYREYGVRKYGFHGTSHYYASRRVAELMDRPVESLKIITCHLGSGCSVDAVRDGYAVDTSMGFTPLEGLVMGTRTGDIDAAAVLYIMKKEGFTPDEMSEVLNRKSGLLGVSGISPDIREIHVEAVSGNESAKLALSMYSYRIKKYISAYNGVLGGIDALVFTGGVGENDAGVRSDSCSGLSFAGIEIDEKKNEAPRDGRDRDISVDDAPVRVFVVHAGEETVIAREAERLCKLSG